MKRYIAKRQFRLGSRIVPEGDVVELSASAARYLRLRRWIEPHRPQPAAEPPADSSPRRPRRRRTT